MDSLALAPAVLLHGFGDSPECWSPLLAAVADDLGTDIAVATPAAPGHARERLPDGVGLTVDSLADAAIGYIEPVVEDAGRPVLLGGHSMGAATAVNVTMKRPDLVAGLYLEDPPWSWPPRSEPDPGLLEQTAELAQWIAGLQGSTHDDRVQWCLDHNPGWPRDEYGIWARAKAEVDPAVFRHPVDIGRYSWQPAVDSVSCHATLLVGEWSRGSVCMPEVADYVEQRGWHVVRVRGAGHDVRRQHRGVAIDAFIGALRRAI